MYPKRKRFLAGGDPDSISRGMRGNVITFAINQDEIADMIKGGKFPRPMIILSTVIAVSFIGLMKMEEVRKSWIKKTFSVRRKLVWKALHWLKIHNRYYHDIELDDTAFWSRIDALPEDDVPMEILANVRQEDRSIGADIEDDSYNPERVDQDDVPIRNIGVEDMDMTKATQMEIMMHALANTSEATREGGYAVRHSSKPINDFGHPRKGESRNPADKNPMAAAFITLFPYGEGGPEDV
ncbi:hypothetical protein CALCODRAFT_509947 [Calocera cornea HHB12733]|uniref:DUF6570 domain-containing protein n=1 Tax=Calocera cornea HHB12733 TaxID=1353952 RepID=A0A165EWV9_9BASI|nr:hypothetical protein CALCODRAFT_509947 [Calocera cornea HHB12733]